MAEITIRNTITPLMSKLSKGVSDMTPAFKQIADYELAQTKMRYIREQDPDGKKWEDPITVRRDGNGGRNTAFNNPWGYVVASNYHAAPPGYHFFDAARGDKIMRDTGSLFLSIGRAYGKDYALVGTNKEYAKKNQEGQGVKARPFLGINKKTIDNVKKVVKFYLMGVSK